MVFSFSHSSRIREYNNNVTNWAIFLRRDLLNVFSSLLANQEMITECGRQNLLHYYSFIEPECGEDMKQDKDPSAHSRS